MTTHQDHIVPTQADRDRASDFADISGSRVLRRHRQHIRHGRADDWDIVQFFARHAQAARQEERAANAAVASDTERECICPRCGIRHGSAPITGDF